MARIPKIIINYSHDSPEHKKRVLLFSNKLREEEGFDISLDQYEMSPPQGWPRWMEEHIKNDDFVLIVCTSNYFQKIMDRDTDNGKGVRWEGNLIYNLIYNSGTLISKFIPILFNDSLPSSIPLPLQGMTHYNIETIDGYDDLCRYITNQPKNIKPALGKIRSRPPEETSSFGQLNIESRRSLGSNREENGSIIRVETVECAFCQGTGEDKTPYILNKDCPVCDGTGELNIEFSEHEKIVECAFCDGKGVDIHPLVIYKPCPVCKGRGVNIIQKNEKPCRKCDGDGKDNSPLTVGGICPVCKGSGYN